jgi:menaquinone-dependent protoporphyrinogen oxidase
MIEQKKISRRTFLKIAGIGLGAGVVVCGGLSTAALYQPPINFIESEAQGAGAMNGKILITYASKCGATGEVAKAIADVITAKGEAVDVKRIKDVKDLSGYKAVLVGSAIRMGAWLSEAVDFVRQNQPALAKAQTSYFTVCLTLKDDTAENRARAASFTEPVRAILKPVNEAWFAGMMDRNKLSLLDRLIANMVKAPEGDFRKWDLIRSWAEQLA